MSQGHEYYRQRSDERELAVELDGTVEGDPYEDRYSAHSQSLDRYKEMLGSHWLDQALRELLEDRIHALSDG